MDRPKEGPFTIAGGLGAVAAVVLTVVGALLPPARLVLGGVLIGFSLATAGALFYLRRLRRDPEWARHKAPALLTPVLSLFGLGLGVFLLAAPAFMTFPGDTQGSASKQAATTPSSTSGSQSSSAPTPSTSATTSPTSSSPTAPPGGAQLAAEAVYTGRVRVADGIYTDLDHQPPTSTGAADLGVETTNHGLGIQNLSGSILAPWPNPTPPTVQDCLTQIATQSQYGVPAQVGTQFCIETSSGHVAYAKVATVQQDAPHAVQIDVTVWDKPS